MCLVLFFAMKTKFPEGSSTCHLLHCKSSSSTSRMLLKLRMLQSFLLGFDSGKFLIIFFPKFLVAVSKVGACTHSSLGDRTWIQVCLSSSDAAIFHLKIRRGPVILKVFVLYFFLLLFLRKRWDFVCCGRCTDLLLGFAPNILWDFLCLCNGSCTAVILVSNFVNALKSE